MVDISLDLIAEGLEEQYMVIRRRHRDEEIEFSLIGTILSNLKDIKRTQCVYKLLYCLTTESCFIHLHCNPKLYRLLHNKKYESKQWKSTYEDLINSFNTTKYLYLLCINRICQNFNISKLIFYLLFGRRETVQYL
jgi:hypothetical protein